MGKPEPTRTRSTNIIITIVAASLAYAIIRYQIFGDVPARQFPLYVANKGAAMSSLLLLGLSLLVRGSDRRRTFGKSGFLLLVAHSAMSITILTPGYFGKYFREDGTYHANIEVGLAFGVVGIAIAGYLFFALPNGNGSSSLRRGVGRIILVVTGIHTALLGYPTWIAVETWPGYLPPITLLATGSAIILLALRSFSGRDNAE